MSTGKRIAISTLLLFLLYAEPGVFAGCRVDDAGPEVVLENEHLRLVVQPDVGGKASSLIYKETKTPLTCWPEYGLFEDRFWLARDNFERQQYESAVEQRGPERAVVRLSCRGRSAPYTDLRLDKRLAIARDSRLVEVEVAFRNLETFRIPVGLWAFQHLIVPEKDTTHFVPTDRGIVTFRHYLKDGKWQGHGDKYLYEFSRGWAGFVAEDGVGAVCMFDPAQVSCVYHYIRRAANLVTTEWIYNQYVLEGGDTWRARYSLLPFSEFSRIDGAGSGAVGGIELTGEPAIGKPVPIKVTLASGRKRALSIKGSCRVLPSHKSREVGSWQAEASPSDTAAVNFDFVPDARGTHVLRLEVSAGPDLLFDMERVFDVGRSTGDYHLPRDFKRTGKEMTQFKARRRPSATYSINAHGIKSDYVTPHIKWAKPYYRGTIRAALSSQRHYLLNRGVAEIAQRLDMDFTWFQHNWIPSATDSSGEAPEYDVIVIDMQRLTWAGGFHWKGYPDWFRKKVRVEVEKGCGLVYFCEGEWWENEDDPLRKAHKAAEPITDRFAKQLPIDVMWPSRRPLAVKAAKLGKGKVVFVENAHHRTGSIRGPRVPFHITEYHYSFLAKLMLEACDRAPDVELVIAGPRQRPLRDLAKGNCTITVTSPRAMSGTLDLTIRDSYGETVTQREAEVRLTEGANSVSFPFGKPDAGLYVTSVQLRDAEGRVVNWASQSLEVTSALALHDVKLGREWYRHGDTVQGTVAVTNEGEQPAALSLVCELWDTDRRWVARSAQSVRVGKEESTHPFAIALRHPLTRMHVLRLKLCKDDQSLAEARCEVFTRPVHTPDFYFFSYRAPHERLKDFGFNAVVDQPIRGTRLDMGCMVWAEPILTVAPKQTAASGGKVRSPCLTDPQFFKDTLEGHRAKRLRGLKYWQRQHAKHGVLGQICADEWRYDGRHSTRSDLCHSPSCRQRFREYLKEVYKDVGALNRAWASTYKDFGEIEPPVWDELLEGLKRRRAGEAGNFRRYIDHQLFKETMIAGFFGRCHEVTAGQVKLGVSGTQLIGIRQFVGWDWWKLFGERNLRCVCAYGGSTPELVRSFAKPEDFISNWGFGFDQLDTQQKKACTGPWHLLFHEADGISFYLENYSPMTFLDWMPRKQALWVKEQADLINRQGIGKLIRQSVRQEDGIAIHYSHASLHADRIAGGPLMEYAWGSVVAIVRDLGLQGRFVSSKQIERGELRDFRALIMSQSHVVSKAEATAIESFLRAGGVVIADFHSAGVSRQCNGAELQHLFGIEVEGHPLLYPDRVKLGSGRELTVLTGYNKLPLDPKQPLRHSTIALTTGKALAETKRAKLPAIIVNAVGQGKAVYLNFALSDYCRARAGGVGGEIVTVDRANREKLEGVREVMRELLRQAGIEAQVQVTVKRTGENWAPEVIRFRDGPSEYVGLLRPVTGTHTSIGSSGLITAKDRQEVLIRLGRKAHVYDVIGRKYHGDKGAIETELVDGKAALFALLPKKVDDLSLSMKEVYRCGEVIDAEVKVTGARNGVALLVISGPDGKERYRFRGSVSDGSARFSVPLALNDPLGKWHAEAVHVVSGARATRSFKVQTP